MLFISVMVSPSIYTTPRDTASVSLGPGAAIAVITSASRAVRVVSAAGAGCLYPFKIARFVYIDQRDANLMPFPSVSPREFLLRIFKAGSKGLLSVLFAIDGKGHPPDADSVPIKVSNCCN